MTLSFGVRWESWQIAPKHLHLYRHHRSRINTNDIYTALLGNVPYLLTDQIEAVWRAIALWVVRAKNLAVYSS